MSIIDKYLYEEELLKAIFGKNEKGVNVSTKKPVISPVKYHDVHVSTNVEVAKHITFLGENTYISDGPDTTIDVTDTDNFSEEEKDILLEKNLSRVQFADQIKIDFIAAIDFRILCRFLGVTTVNDIKNHPFQSHPLITLILMESIEGFMKSGGYEYVGELNFDSHGNSIPPEINPWNVKGKETAFIITGFLFFKKINGEPTDNVSFYLYADLERGGASITCYSTDTNKSKDIVNDLQIFSKKFNCLRGAKLKDVNMIAASFSEVEINEKYTWDNYYYPKEIKDLFSLEVFDFVDNVEKYNKCGINKRGLILHGKPGCVLADTYIKVRKKKKEGKHNIISQLPPP